MTELPNKIGSCPKCRANWDGGDIYEELAKMGINHAKTSTQLVELAGNFGWAPGAPLRFSRTISVQPQWGVSNKQDRPAYMQCPDCRAMWDLATGLYVPPLGALGREDIITDEPANPFKEFDDFLKDEE